MNTVIQDDARDKFVKEWIKRYEKNYAFKGSFSPGEQNQNMLFYEGVHEMAKHIVACSDEASCIVNYTPTGVVELVIKVKPKEILTPKSTEG